MTKTIFTPLYFANYFVDQVQNSKNMFVDLTVQDEKLREPIKQFVEAQRIYTKEVNRTVSQIFDVSGSLIKSSMDSFADAFTKKSA